MSLRDKTTANMRIIPKFKNSLILSLMQQMWKELRLKPPEESNTTVQVAVEITVEATPLNAADQVVVAEAVAVILRVVKMSRKEAEAMGKMPATSSTKSELTSEITG